MADRSLKILNSHEHERYQSPMPSVPQAPVNVARALFYTYRNIMMSCPHRHSLEATRVILLFESHFFLLM